MEAFTPKNRLKTIILLAISILLAAGAILAGIDDNPPGVLMAECAAIFLIVALVHPWRSTRKFLYLLLAAVLGIILFVVLSIFIDTVVQNPSTPQALRELPDSPGFEITSMIIVLLSPVALIIGMVGWIIMLIRNRWERKKT